MTPTTTAEFVIVLLAADPQQPNQAVDLVRLSTRERELVTLVARGRTDAQIAERLFVSVRTVRSHLDRIRDRPGADAAPTSPGLPWKPASSSQAGSARVLVWVVLPRHRRLRKGVTRPLL